MGHPLDGVQAKIDRAKEHFEELKTVVEDFKAATTQRVVFSFDAASGKYVGDVKIPEHPPLKWPVVVGDVAHNLRSSLDHLAYQLEILAGRKPDRKTAFPVFWEPAKFDKAVKGGLERRFPKQAWAVIDSMQPCVRRDRYYRHPLYRLHFLNIRDKHHLPNLVFTAFKFPQLTIIEKDPRGNPVAARPVFGAGPGPLSWANIPPGVMRFNMEVPGGGPQLEMQGEFDFEVRFEEDPFGKGDFLIDLIQQLIEFVEKTVGKLQAVFP